MQENPNYATSVAAASVEDRSQFIWKVYAHVVGGILAFAAIEGYLFSTGLGYQIAYALMSVNWLLVIGGLMLTSWGATHLAVRMESTTAHYVGFALLVFGQAILFTVPFAIALQTNPAVIESAAGVTILGCVGLIATAMITRKDFSFLRGILTWGFMLALLAIAGGVIFGFHLGTWFSVAMIGFAGAAVLYDTSNIMHHYPSEKYVAASMALFASIMLMFWYVLQLFLSRD